MSVAKTPTDDEENMEVLEYVDPKEDAELSASENSSPVRKRTQPNR
jgi:hypothetical protein